MASVYGATPLPTARVSVPAAGAVPPRTSTRAGVRAVGGQQLGQYHDRLPVSQPARPSFSGLIGANVTDDYYDTIWTLPSRIAVGNITANTVRQVEVWNAYRAPRTLERIDISGGDGITVSGVSLPYEFGPWESTTFVTRITPTGPAIIDARYDLVFSPAEPPIGWSVTGRRIIQWTVPPNWTDGVTERLEYRTEILRSTDGTEQRIAQRHQPRRSLEFTPLVEGFEARNAWRLLTTWQARNYAMADWAYGVPTAAVPAGAVAVELLEEIPELYVGQLLVLATEAFTQALEIASIDGMTIALNTPVAQAFPRGARAYPGLTVHVDGDVSGRRHTASTTDLALRFREMWRAGQVPSSAPLRTWNDLEVWITRPEWREQPEDTFSHPVDWLDANRGRFDFRVTQEWPMDSRSFLYTLEGRDAVRELKRFFHRCKGRRAAFYLPTFAHDVAVRSGQILIGGGLAMPIDSVETASRIAGERVYRNLYIRLLDGTELLRRVTGGDVTIADQPSLALDEPWPRDITAQEIAAISWMPRCRLASDELAIRWRTDGIAEARLAVQTLEDA